jgi:threonine dehydrogenase-like Zn-dependent dehydrogenase
LKKPVYAGGCLEKRDGLFILQLTERLTRRKILFDSNYSTCDTEGQKMKALRKFAPGNDGIALFDREEPVPKEGELKVRVFAAGICGGDLHALKDERAGLVMPVTLGHEFVGQVVETNGDTGGFATGDWIVTLPACYSCGECEFCRAGLVTLCKQRKSIGCHVDGAMAEYVVVPAKYSFKVPSDPERLVEYALAEPLGCVARGIYEKLNVKPGDVAVVSGPGTIGLCAVALLAERGAHVIASGLPMDRARLAVAKQMGAEITVESFEELKKAVSTFRASGEADIAVEASGAEGSLHVCMEIVRTLGTLLQLGYYGKKVNCQMDRIFDKEIRFVASNSTAVSTWPVVLELIRSRRVDVTPLISLKIPLSDFRHGFDASIDKTAYKALLMP